MKLLFSRFNIILVLLLVVTTACKTTEEKKKAREATSLRFHLETNRDGTPHNAPILVYRSAPILVTAERDALLDEGFMAKAEMVPADDFGNQAIKISFDEAGTKRLDYITSANKGRRFVLIARWTETRCLAAPLITKRITDGVFIFTPDASPEECKRIISGLNNTIARLKKPYTLI